MQFCVWNANPSYFSGTLLEGDKDQLLNQARSDLARKEIHVESLNKCIDDLQKRTEVKVWASQEAQHGFAESRREQARLQEELIRKETACTNWKRWRERKYSKLTKCRFKNWKRITRLLNSPLHNCSNCKNRWILWTVLENSSILNQIKVEDCLTFPVKLRWFRVPVICSAATKCCRLIHGINPECRKKRFWNQFSTFDSPRDFPQRISSENVHRNREAIPHQPKVKASLTSGDGQNNGTIPMPTFASRPLTTSSTIPVELPQNYVGGQQR